MPVSKGRAKKNNKPKATPFARIESYRICKEILDLMRSLSKRYRDDIYPNLFGRDHSVLPERFRLVMEECTKTFPDIFKKMDEEIIKYQGELDKLTRVRTQRNSMYDPVIEPLDDIRGNILTFVIPLMGQYDEALVEICSILEDHYKNSTEEDAVNV